MLFREVVVTGSCTFGFGDRGESRVEGFAIGTKLFDEDLKSCLSGFANVLIRVIRL